MKNTRCTWLSGVTALVPVVLVCFAIGSGCDMKPEEKTSVDWVAETMKAMTPGREVGQLFFITVDPIKYYLDPPYKRDINDLIRKYNPGGVYLSSVLEDWKAEILSEFNADKLLAEIIRMQELLTVPLIVGADFESGAWFWDDSATRFPYPMALGTSRSTDLAYRQAQITSVEAKAQGVNILFAPTLNTSAAFDDAQKIRAFGQDPALVAQMGKSFINGCRQIGIAPCPKYFPIAADSSPHSEESLAPFKTCIDSGIRCIMTTPLDAGGGDRESLHAGVSASIGGLLRGKLGFKGIVVSSAPACIDSAVSAERLEQDVLKFIEEGCTMLILPETREKSIPVLDRLSFDAEEDRIDMTGIESTVRSILALKNDIGLRLGDDAAAVRGIAGIGLAEYNATSDELVRKSILMLKNDNAVFPLKNDVRYYTSICFSDKYSAIEAAVFDKTLKGRFPGVHHINVVGSPDTQLEAEIRRRVAETKGVVCWFFIRPVSGIPGLPEDTLRLLRWIAGARKHSAAVAFTGPYLVDALPDFDGFIVIYSQSERAMETALQTAFGENDPLGVLPAPVGKRFPEGFGLHYGDANK